MLSARNEIVEALKARVREAENACRAAWGSVTSGGKPLDALLGGGGFRRGALVEWIGGMGSGAGTLAMIAAREACREGRGLVVVDGEGVFYPPAAAGLGIDLTRMIVVCPRNRRDHDWALNQSLQCSGVGAVLCWAEKVEERTFRGLQLAAEAGGSLGFLIRPEKVLGTPSWSDVQLLVKGMVTRGKGERRVRVEVIRRRGGSSGKAVELEINDETGAIQEANSLPLVSELAHPAAAPRSAGA